MASKEEDLPFPCGLPQPLQCQMAAAVVKSGKSVIQNDGHGFVRGQYQFTDRQPDSEIQLVSGSGGEIGSVSGKPWSCGLRGQMETAVQHDAAVFPGGEFGENLSGAASQGRGEAVLQGSVGAFQS